MAHAASASFGDCCHSPSNALHHTCKHLPHSKAGVRWAYLSAAGCHKISLKPLKLTAYLLTNLRNARSLRYITHHRAIAVQCCFEFLTTRTSTSTIIHTGVFITTRTSNKQMLASSKRIKREVCTSNSQIFGFYLTSSCQ